MSLNIEFTFMKVLLSPAKALDMTKEISTPISSSPIFMEESEYLVKKLAKFSARKIGKMMSLSTDLSNLNFERYQSWESIGDLNGKNNYASVAFNGEVYRGFDATSLDQKGISVAQSKVRILSGLYGLLKPFDVIYPYRLEMGTKWPVTPKETSLYKFWGPKLADELNSEEIEVIVNLASQEYFKAVDRKVLNAAVITPLFKELKNGEYKTVMVFAKRARGTMARYIVDNDIDNVEDIKNFTVDGYLFDENQSNETVWVFTR